MPRPPAPYARRGTAFHRWLESRWGQQRLLDPDELPGAADEGAADDSMLTELQRRFEESEWASRRPLDIEVTFETVLGDRVLRGRMDAVFTAPDGGYEVVDWKTGRPPPTRTSATPPSNWPPTAWPGPTWPASPWRRSAPPSTTSATTAPSAPPTSSTAPA